MMDLSAAWFLLVGVLLTGYVILDGFDLGVGILSLFARDKGERREHIEAIGPVWDGNEVWLVTGGAALFAAFPPVYATVFEGFYTAFMSLLLALIGRAVGIEFFGKVDSVAWRRTWGWVFGLGSLVAATLLGVAFGNVLRGLPIGEGARYQGTFLGLLNAQALPVGALAVALFVAHGALYLSLKAGERLRARCVKVALAAWGASATLFVLSTAALLFGSPMLLENARGHGLFWPVLVLLAASIISVSLCLKARRNGLAFLGSSLTIASMMAISGLSLFPALAPSSLDPAWSLTIHNASSSPQTLKAMLIITLTGMPVVIGYSCWAHHVFRGTVGDATYAE